MCHALNKRPVMPFLSHLLIHIRTLSPPPRPVPLPISLTSVCLPVSPLFDHLDIQDRSIPR